MPSRTVTTDDDRAGLLALMRNLDLPFTASWVKGRDRSSEQNRTQWMWAVEVAQQKGDEDAADIQADWKLRHGVPILREDSEEFREVYDRTLKPLTFEAKLKAMRFLDIGVTRCMKVRQMSRYLDAIQQECAEMGFELTQPENVR